MRTPIGLLAACLILVSLSGCFETEPEPAEGPPEVENPPEVEPPVEPVDEPESVEVEETETPLTDHRFARYDCRSFGTLHHAQSDELLTLAYDEFTVVPANYIAGGDPGNEDTTGLVLFFASDCAEVRWNDYVAHDVRVAGWGFLTHMPDPFLVSDEVPDNVAKHFQEWVTDHEGLAEALQADGFDLHATTIDFEEMEGNQDGYNIRVEGPTPWEMMTHSYGAMQPMQGFSTHTALSFDAENVHVGLTNLHNATAATGAALVTGDIPGLTTAETGGPSGQIVSTGLMDEIWFVKADVEA